MATKTAILYARVSTPGQAEDGYSLRQQLAALREHAAHEGFEIIEEIEDAGWSGATLERPGMDRVRERVSRGDVRVVIAQDRDRLSREPAYLFLLKEEFAARGCSLRALSSRNDDSPEGELTDGILDQLAKYRRAKIRDSTRLGKHRKVTEGKLLGSGPAPSGFRWVLNGKGKRVRLAVNEETMPVVRRLFELVGRRGMAMYAAGRQLESEGHMAPKGGPWRVSVIRTILQRDCYRPHTREEIAALVTPEVSEPLDPEGTFGVHYFGKRRVTGPARGSRTYRNQPREEWLAVPIPDAGVPLAWVEEARENTRNNPRPAFSSARVHELSGGVAVCGVCGRNLTTSTSGSSKTRKWWYYSCPAARRRECEHKTMYRAETLEAEVVALVDWELLTDRETLEQHLDAAAEKERSVSPGFALRTAEALSGRLASIADRRAAYQDQQAAGLMTLSELAEKLRALEGQHSAVEGELERARHATERVVETERAKRAVLSMFGTGLMLGLHWFPPRLRRHVYGLMALRVAVHPGGALELSGRFDADLMRLTPEVEAWVEGLRAVDEQTRDATLDTVERELTALRSRMSLRAGDATSG